MRTKLLSIALLLLCNFTVAQKYLPKSNGEIVRHSYYILSYIEEHEQAEWVYYKLTPDMIKGKTERTENFRQDPKVKTKSATPADYRKSGYDRGHLCPAASMRHNHKAMSETFYMSNISPQVPAFNRGVWRRLEQHVRDWVLKDSVLYVITGTIFPDSTQTAKKKIGCNQVTIPTHYYKIIHSPKHSKSVGYIIPNQKSNNPISAFIVPIDSIKNIIVRKNCR